MAAKEIDGKGKKENFTWLMACVLFCHAGAMQGRRKVGRVSENTVFMPIYKLGVVG